MLRALPIAAMLACGRQAESFTLCGQPIFDADATEVANLRTVERASLYAIERNAFRRDGSPMMAHEVCHSLYGIRLSLSDDLGTSKTCDCETPPVVCGRTHLGIDGDHMELLRVPWSASCLAHEQMHVAQWRLDGEAEPHHDHWKERGYYAAEVDARETLKALGM